MKQKTLALLITTSFIVSYTFVFAQTLDTTAPAPEPVMIPEADTTPPGFISVATTASEETPASIVWTTDEMAYGYIEYGETQSYGVATPQSSQAAMDHSQSPACNRVRHTISASSCRMNRGMKRHLLMKYLSRTFQNTPQLCCVG